jgi:hypothetical protein
MNCMYYVTKPYPKGTQCLSLTRLFEVRVMFESEPGAYEAVLCDRTLPSVHSMFLSYKTFFSLV